MPTHGGVGLTTMTSGNPLLRLLSSTSTEDHMQVGMHAVVMVCGLSN